jgi:hypothetical protein
MTYAELQRNAFDNVYLIDVQSTPVFDDRYRETTSYAENTIT